MRFSGSAMAVPLDDAGSLAHAPSPWRRHRADVHGRVPCHHRPMAATRELTPARRLRSIFSGSVGNLVEWYDWYVYAAFSLYFAEGFFPGGDRTSQLLKTAAIFAVGFLMRPLGGWLLGRYADRHGRKAALL